MYIYIYIYLFLFFSLLHIQVQLKRQIYTQKEQNYKIERQKIKYVQIYQRKLTMKTKKKYFFSLFSFFICTIRRRKRLD